MQILLEMDDKIGKHLVGEDKQRNKTKKSSTERQESVDL